MRHLVVALLLPALLALPAPLAAQQPADPLAHVDPLIGSFAPGFTNPGPALPHGLVGLGPDTVEGPANYGGYYITNAAIAGFSHTHMSAGVFHGGHFPVMPVVGEVDASRTPHPAGAPIPGYASPYDHATQFAEPGYYAVTLERYGVRAELTATERTGLHRYAFPPAGPRRIVVDLSRTLRGDHPADVGLAADGRTLLGTVHTEVSGPLDAHLALEVDADASWSLADGRVLEPGSTVSADAGLVVVATLPAGTDEALVRTGLSYTDTVGALANLRAEQPGWDFDATHEAARAAWLDALSVVEVSGGTDAQLTSFYTALYHARLFPNIHSDVDGRYRGADGAVHTSTERPRYSQFSLWDTYRGQSALLAVIDPDRYVDMLASLADFAELGGRLPRWQLGPNDPGYMSGDPVIPFIAEGVCRGFVPEPLEAELLDHAARLLDARPADYETLGYLPVPQAPLHAQLEAGGREAGRTLEYGVADGALVLLAARAGDETLRDRALEGALKYRNLVDPVSGFVRPRDADGEWLEEFAPENGYGFQEGTSWQYSWLAMQDLAGLLERMGAASDPAAVGPEQRLDVLFNLPVSGTVPVLWPKVQNQATVFGIFYYGNQFAPGNEHDLEAPYVYTWLGVPWKAQAAARATTSIYTPTPDGLPGNDDLGALSGWLVWAMIGLQPVVPGAPGYVVGSPHFERVVIHRDGGDLAVTAAGASPVNRFVQDSSLDSVWATEDDLTGEVTFTMGPAPSQWGATTSPPSLSTHPLAAFGCS